MEEMRPQIVIIMENTLGSMALRSLLSDITPNVDVLCYSSTDEYLKSPAKFVVHFFISTAVAFNNAEMFRPMMRRTIVITEGPATIFTLSGFRTLDITQSEQHIVRAMLRMRSEGHHTNSPEHSLATADDEHNMLLSAREQDVLALVVKGYINKEIADELNITLATVVFHRNNIYDKLHTRSIGRLTIYAVLNNIVTLSDL